MIGGTLSHFEIVELLGGSRTDALYRARDREDGSAVVVRLLSGLEPPELRRLLRDGRAATRLDHPNLCTIFEVAEVDGDLLLAMPFVAGESLAARIAQGPLPPANAAQIALQAVAGLIEAHEQGVVHGDLRPSNLRLDATDRLKVVGFEPVGAISGATPYRAPEQLRGEAPGPASDIWALGAVLFAMVAGQPPFSGGDEEALVQAILHDEPAWPGDEDPEAAALLAIAATAMAKRPAERYVSLDELWRDLQSARESGSDGEGSNEDGATERFVNVSRSTSRAATRPRPSLVGPTVQHYRILERLGSGGMGVVYKAQDTRLDRTVALKFLPPDLTRNPQAKARFLREAKAASALDHPNICTVHEVGETADGQLYLAMSCYDGETLKRKIERGPLPIEEAVDIAWQAAQGLAKAHRQGIVHRDVKPANLIVTTDGIVKILDFGLAKLAGAAGLTRAGYSLGTPAYMSPEQVRGEVDQRTDIWSLGVVIYEMVAGVAPFRGDNDQAVLYNLVTEEPAPLGELRPDVPPALDRIVSLLLQKAADDRYPSFDGVVADLRSLLGPPSSSTLQPAFATAGRPAGRRRLSPWLAALPLALIATWVVLSGRTLLRLTPRKAPPASWTSRRLTDQEGRELFPSLSPDGDRVVYAKGPKGNSDLWLQPLDGMPRNLTADSPVDDTQPAFSPDGRQIVFRSERDRGGLFLMGADGGSVRRLTDTGFNPSWSPDGKVVYASEGVSEPSSRTSHSTLEWIDTVTRGKGSVDTRGDAVQPSWSPNGLRIAYWGLVPSTAARKIWTVPARGGTPVAVTDERSTNWNPVWSPDGKYLYFASDRAGSMNLWRVPIDEPSGRVLGPAEAVTVATERGAFPSLSKDGEHLAYATDETRENLLRVAFDPLTSRTVGEPVPLTAGKKRVRSAELSPDGAWIVYDSDEAHENLVLMRSDGSAAKPLTQGWFRDRIPRWSPTGDRILFYSDRDGAYEPWEVRPDSSGLVHLIHVRSGPTTAIYYPIWSPDGNRLACSVDPMGGAIVDLRVPFERRVPSPLPSPPQPGDLFAPTSWSPDGGTLVGSMQNDRGPGGPRISIYTFATQAYEELTERGELPVWLHRSRRLLYIDDGKVFLLDVASRRSQLLLEPQRNFHYSRVSVGPDDRNLFLVLTTDEGDICLLSRR